MTPSERAEKMFHQWMIDYGGYLGLHREEVCKAIAAQIEEHGNEMFRAAREKAKWIAENFDCSSRPPKPCCGAETEIAQHIAELEQ